MQIEEKDVKMAICKSNNEQLRVVIRAHEKEIEKLKKEIEELKSIC